MKVRLSIDECPVHRLRAICVSGNPQVGGTRLTPSKCCGQWRQVKAWDVEAEKLIDDIRSEMRAAPSPRAETKG